MLRSCRWRSKRLNPGCCAKATCSVKPIAPISATPAMIRVAFMWTSFVPQVRAVLPGSDRLTQRLERGSELGTEQLGLLPRSEVSALVDLVEVDEVAIGAPRPCLR